MHVIYELNPANANHPKPGHGEPVRNRQRSHPLDLCVGGAVLAQQVIVYQRYGSTPEIGFGDPFQAKVANVTPHDVSLTISENLPPGDSTTLTVPLNPFPMKSPDQATSYITFFNDGRA